MSAPAESKTMFFDDFGLGRLDRSKWNVRTTGKVVNDEQQAYIDSLQTAYITSGVPGAGRNVLVLHPRYRPGFTTADGQRFDFVSGRIDTKGEFRFVYGSASARMKLPAGPTCWPAFWVMGDGSWPNNGEIDVMEYVGREPDLIIGTLHGPGYSGASGVSQWNRQEYAIADDFHTYAIEWKPGQIDWYYDGEKYHTVTPGNLSGRQWVFDQPFFVILNLAVGGRLGGPIGLDTVFPAQYTVDYVRVYQAADS